jgi:hypothetical protein
MPIRIPLAIAAVIFALVLSGMAMAAPKRQDTIADFDLNATTAISLTVTLTNGQMVTIPIDVRLLAEHRSGETTVSLAPRVAQQPDMFIGVRSAPSVSGTLQTIPPAFQIPPTPTHTPVPPTPTRMRQTPTSTPTRTPSPPPATPAVDLQALLLAELGESNRDVSRISDFSISADLIEIEWAINDNLTEGFIKTGARIDVADMLKVIRESGVPVSTVRLVGTFSMVDSFGNASEMPVERLTFSAETIEKINWSDRGYVNNVLHQYVHEIADELDLHPAFQE